MDNLLEDEFSKNILAIIDEEITPDFNYLVEESKLDPVNVETRLEKLENSNLIKKYSAQREEWKLHYVITMLGKEVLENNRVLY